jgi:hypothetical protein
MNLTDSALERDSARVLVPLIDASSGYHESSVQV